MPNRIAVQMLCGRNEEPFLKYALQSVHWADYVTLCNTDPTSYWGKINQQIAEETCQKYGLELRYNSLTPDPDGCFSFGEARNICLSMTDPDDYVFIVDADDVHFPDWERTLKRYIESGADSITTYYYHLMVYKDIYQASFQREIVFKLYPETTWTQGVHEQLVTVSKWPVVSTYHYMHYGYIKPQAQIFDRWKLYSDIVGDYDHYNGQDPENIVTDRISVSKPLPVEHPPAVQGLLESYPPCPPGRLRDNGRETSAPERVGLVLLTYNDKANLYKCLETLVRTQRSLEWEVMAIDMGSTDGTIELLDEYTSVMPMDVYEAGELRPLAETLNFAFNNFRLRHDIKYIGWIHPDMVFDDPMWLVWLWQELRDHPRIGKICSANTRDTVPTELIPGQEQCFIIRKEIINYIGLFDEGYVGIGGYEDWDMNRRIMNHDDYKVMISPRSRVWHQGMATRERRDTTADQMANGMYYLKKWGTSAPPC